MKRVLAVLAVAVAVGACGGGSATTIRVFAAASLMKAFTDGRASGATFDFAGSNALVTRIEQGAPADVIATADSKNMDKLVAAGLVDRPVVFARNQLEIAVQPGNPKGITGIEDLRRTGIVLVLGAPGVPAGDYARQVLDAGVTPRSLESDVKAAIAKVTTHEADATIAYATDVDAAGATVTGVPLPADRQPVIEYPIAVVKATKRRADAEAFVRSAVSGEVQASLRRAGFLPPR